MSAYTEFDATEKKLTRYNNTVVSFQKLLVWWNSLSLIEKANAANVESLVMEVEQVHLSEFEAWLSSPKAPEHVRDK